MEQKEFHRYFMQLSYNGEKYHGWQRQPNANTVQQELEEKLSLVLREAITVTGAGRTDAGVHARNYVAHFDVSKPLENQNDLIYKLNTFLSTDIAIYSIKMVNNDAHARFSASSRTYKYYISTRKDPFRNKHTIFLPSKLNLELMQKAARMIKEYTDFECFSKVKTDVSNFECSVLESYWNFSDDELVYTVKANRFLRNMVRAIVGTLLEVGQEKLSIDGFRKVIESKDRSLAGKSVDGKALFLENIEYPPSIYPK